MSQAIRDARERIKKVRMKDVAFFVLKDGAPVEDAKVSVQMKNHQFLFGAVCYQYGKYPSEEMNALFTREFTKLFNYTMVPFHWNWYEPKRHEYNEPYTGNLLKWAEENNLKRKLHALVWHECCPDWAQGKDVQKLYEERISYLMKRYGERFDFIDVVNETTVIDRFDNPVSRWIKEAGPVKTTQFATKLVRTYKPDAKLLYGDWNVHVEAYYDHLKALRDNDVDIDILGMQSHMHRDLWTQEETLRVMDRAAEFGWPIHFPECSVCSGTPIGEMQYGAGAINQFNETEEDLYFQADFTKDFYTLVFSHPAVEALSWFDFTDHRWLNAPAGVVTDDLAPKPVYHTLYDLIHKQWHTDAQGITDAQGMFRSRLFFGNYDIIVEAQGQRHVFNRDILRPSFYAGDDIPRRVSINL